MENIKKAVVIDPTKTMKNFRTLSRFSPLDSKIILRLENRKESRMAIQNSQFSNPSMEENLLKQQSIPVYHKKPCQGKTSLKKIKSISVSEPAQAVNLKISRLQSPILQRLKPSYSLSLESRQNLKDKVKKVLQKNQQELQKPALRIIDLLRGKKRDHHGKKKRIDSEEAKVQTDNYENEPIIKKQVLKYSDNSKRHQDIPYLKLSREKHLSTSKDFKQFQCSIQISHFQQQALKQIRLSKMSIYSQVHSLDIQSRKMNSIQKDKKSQTVDKQIQTFQSQQQFFQYLTYKRKKSQYEAELQHLSKYIEIFRQDHHLCNQRVPKIYQIYDEPPKTQRQKRIFELQKQTQDYKTKIMSQINDNIIKSDQNQARILKLHHLLANGFKKLQNINKTYFKFFKETFQKHNQQKFIRIASRIQLLSSNMLKEIYYKVKRETQHFKKENDSTNQIRSSLVEYMKCIDQKKVLLKNCFGHIKSVPELFYKLFGDQVKQNAVDFSLNVVSLAMKQKDLISCSKCYQLDRKISLIVEKNAEIKSVLKVASQLVS